MGVAIHCGMGGRGVDRQRKKEAGYEEQSEKACMGLAYESLRAKDENTEKSIF